MIIIILQSVNKTLYDLGNDSVKSNKWGNVDRQRFIEERDKEENM